MMIRPLALAVTLGATLVACTTTAPTPVAPVAVSRPLIVGTDNASPPYAFRRDGQLVGLEVDLAHVLGTALGRPVDIVELPWDELFTALSAGRVDVVMAGVTATPERQGRFAFSEPYMWSAMAAVVRSRDRDRYRSRDAVCKSPVDTGVVTGTTGEKYVRSRCPAMIPRQYPNVTFALLEVRNNRLDLVVHDEPVLRHLLASATDLALVPTAIGDEPIAWMFRRDDAELTSQANAALATARADGTLDALIARWIPRPSERR